MWKHVNIFLSKKVVDIDDIPSEEVHWMRMIILDGLRDINDVHLVIEIQHVVLTQIGMHQLTLLEEDTHIIHHLEVYIGKLFSCDVYVF